MDLIEFNFPWEHFVIDDILPDYIINDVEDNIDIIHKYHFYNLFLNKSVYKLNENISVLDNIIKNTSEYLDNIFNLEKNFKSVTSIQSLNPNSKFEIHDERPEKLKSIIIYVSPEDNIGTYLYSNQLQDFNYPDKKIDWKINRAFIFTGKQDITWHSFMSNENVRVTLNYFLYEKN